MRWKDKKRLFRRAQSTLEYAVLIVLITGALLATQYYIKRGVQGRFKQSADDIGEQFSTSGNVSIITRTQSYTNETVQGRITTSNLITPSWSNRYENADMPTNFEYFGQ